MAIAQQNCLNDRCCLCQTPPSSECIALGICSIVKILQVLISCKIQVLMHFLDLRFDWSIFYIHTRTVVKGLGCVNHLLRTNKVGCEGRSRVPQIKTMSKGAPNTDDQVMWPIFWGRGRVLAQMSYRRRGSGCATGGNKGAAVLNGNVISGTRSCLCAGMQHYDLFCFHAFVNNWSIT